MAIQDSGKISNKIIFDQFSYANTNSIWGALCVEVLARLGLRHAVIAPGSRSAPLTFAFSRHRDIETLPVLDERSASFFALGLARKIHRPVAVVCTSGTAAANFYPAIIEARESQIPLIVMTADRPPELRHCHSGQSIDQQKIFGTYPNIQIELSTPSLETARLKYLRQTLVHCWERCRFPTPGPVHLNFPFREPLAPIEEEGPLAFPHELDLLSLINNIEPLCDSKMTINPTLENGISEKMESFRQGLIIVGPNQPENPEKFSSDIGIIAKRLGWPTLADGLSPLRNYANSNPYLITHYHYTLSHPDLRHGLRPSTVLSIGPLPSSKILRSWLEKFNARTWVLDQSYDNVDALHRDATPLRMSVAALAQTLQDRSPRSTGFCNNWIAAEKKISRILNKELKKCKFPFEGKIAWVMSKIMPRGTPLFIANSMPVRDVEYFWTANNRQVQPFFNRGANGIDGTLSTALGIAHANKKAVLLTGDLALLHDTNGFLTNSQFKGHLTIVLINNSGGGIFEQLPIAKFNPPFEEYFATPQDINFKKLAEVYKVSHFRVKNLDQLRDKLRKLPSSGLRILEVITNRKKDTRYLSELSEIVAKQIKL